jgi:hypothetical protein
MLNFFIKILLRYSQDRGPMINAIVENKNISQWNFIKSIHAHVLFENESASIIP